MTTLLILVVALSLFSCQEQSKRKVVIYDYDRSNNLNHQLDAEVILNKNKEELEFVYIEPNGSDSLTFVVIKQNVNIDSLLVMYSDTLKLFNKKSYLIDNTSWEIKKYYINASGIADGSYLIYFNNELGVIALQSQAWGNFLLFEYEYGQISQELKQDTSGFFNPFVDVPIR